MPSILFQSARRDRPVSVDRAEALHAAFSGQKEVRWYDTEHALNPTAYMDQLHWLNQTVGTTPPAPGETKRVREFPHDRRRFNGDADRLMSARRVIGATPL